MLEACVMELIRLWWLGRKGLLTHEPAGTGRGHLPVVALFNEDGKAGVAISEYLVYHPIPAGPKSPRTGNRVNTIRETLNKGVQPEDIAGIGADGQAGPL